MLTLQNASVGRNRGHGIVVQDEARLRMRGGAIRENQGIGLSASGSARVRLDGVTLAENVGWNIELSDQAEARWIGDGEPERRKVHPGASWSEGSSGVPNGVGHTDT